MNKIETVDDVINSMPRRFQPLAARGVTAKYQWLISGEGGKDFCVFVDDGKFEIIAGEVPDPSVTFRIEKNDYLRLVNNELKGMTAILTRKLKVNGNIYLANKMEVIFK